MHLTGVHLAGVHLTGVHLTYRHASHRLTSTYRRASHRHLTYRRASHTYTPMSEVPGSIRARSCSEPNMRAEYASLLRPEILSAAEANPDTWSATPRPPCGVGALFPALTYFTSKIVAGVLPLPV
jgi:hypothetical protein